LLGEIFRETGRIEQAKKQYKRVIEHYSYAQCWDPRGWLWKVSDLAKDRLLAIENDVDWYNSSSENLTQNTWKYYGEDDYKKAEFFAKKCIDLYLESAKQQQKEITKMPQANFIPYYWAVNDVGTCCFILGEIYTKQNKISDAVKMFETVVNDIYYSQCWDPKGWYWQVAAVCRDRLNKIVNYKNE
jgi:tetratricopeptide (TPR) repeat protein